MTDPVQFVFETLRWADRTYDFSILYVILSLCCAMYAAILMQSITVHAGVHSAPAVIMLGFRILLFLFIVVMLLSSGNALYIDSRPWTIDIVERSVVFCILMLGHRMLGGRRGVDALMHVQRLQMPKAEPGCSPHGWTLDTLEQSLRNDIGRVEKYFTDLGIEREARNKERFDAAREAVQSAMASSEKALTKAEAASEKRQDASNEIRAAMIDQQTHFADKEQTDFRLRALEERAQVTVGRAQGMGSLVAIVVQIVSGLASIGAIVGVAIALIKH